MVARTDILSADPGGSYGSKEHAISSLVEAVFGCGYPLTVNLYINPFQGRPEDLNEHMCYLVCSDEIGGSNVGSWKQNGEPRLMLLPDLPIVCKEITRGFVDGDNRETDWTMQQYNFTTASVGGAVPLDKYPHLTDHHTFPAAKENLLFEAGIFSEGDFIELLDLEDPLLPHWN